MKFAKMTIYDYKNKTTEITLPDKEITEIFVHVVSGDETGYVAFVDGSTLRFDSSDCRIMDFDDGCYSVEGENIQKWFEFEPSGERTVSYERMDYMYELE